MRNPLLIWSSLISLVAGSAFITAWADGVVRDYPAAQISPHVWVIEGPLGFPSIENQGFMNNPAFVITGSGVVVIDPGSSVQAGRMVLKQIRQVTDLPVTHVLDSHVHGDHWLGNQAILEAFPDAVFMAHPEMIARAKGFAGDEWLRIMEESTAGFTAGTRAVIPEHPVADADAFSVAGMRFRILAPGAAHSGTDIMIEVVDDGVLFLGDNVTYQRIARLDDATFKGSIEACRIALQGNSSKFVPGHGPVGGREVVESYLRYLSTLYTQVTHWYEEGLEDFEMKPRIVAALAEYADWVNFDDQVGKHISLAILEYENAL
ncbi:MAG: MBL fold metallo-hydrolase [Gammaproteobacteria bacterium]|nr:MBL fold metallo-hydrolase [Gammaproteobacteria bacterium]